MNVLEKADKYAEGKATAAITKAIAEAYAEGYRDGYNDREQEIPAEFRDQKTEYVDLGLPSGTFWSKDYEKADGEIIFVPFKDAEYEKIPTKEQWYELVRNCKIFYNIDHTYDFCSVDFVGPNGNILTFSRTGHYLDGSLTDVWEGFFWIEDSDSNNANEAGSLHLYNYGKTRKTHEGRCLVKSEFTGYKLALRLVR